MANVILILTAVATAEYVNGLLNQAEIEEEIRVIPDPERPWQEKSVYSEGITQELRGLYNQLIGFDYAVSSSTASGPNPQYETEREKICLAIRTEIQRMATP